MKNSLPLSLTILGALALTLSACGKTESVDQLPSGDELAKQADAAARQFRDTADGKDSATGVAALPLDSYQNDLRGYSVMVPAGWTVDMDNSNDSGRSWTDQDSGATLSVGWSENRDDSEFQEAIAAATPKTEPKAEGETAPPPLEGADKGDVRLSSAGAKGAQSIERLLKTPDGALIRVKVSYPGEQAKAVGPVAKQVLDSLRLL